MQIIEDGSGHDAGAVRGDAGYPTGRQRWAEMEMAGRVQRSWQPLGQAQFCKAFLGGAGSTHILWLHGPSWLRRLSVVSVGCLES